MTHTGKCLCGAVSYELAELPKETGACHCEMCRKWSGGVFMGFSVHTDKITFKNEDAIQRFASSDWAERGFCKTCGSSVFYKVTLPGPHSEIYHMGFGTLDAQTGIPMNEEIFIDRKPDSYAFAGDHKTMTEADVMAMFAPPPAD